ncbi:DUF5053 domain-containing protein [Phocaeicola sp.]
MTLKDELLALKPLFGTDSPEFYERVESIADRYNSDYDKQIITDFIAGKLHSIDSEIDNLQEKAIKLQMQEVSDIISLSYLAKKYFNKSRSWIYQRMNGNIVNGKPARFTNEELTILNSALKDISEKLGSLSISY